MDQLKHHDWYPAAHGPQANCIPLAAVTTTAGGAVGMVGHPMPKLDLIVKLAKAMVTADTATRHVSAAWEALQLTRAGTVCKHPRVHPFPALPLCVDGVVLFNFPCVELCVFCGYVTAP